jgi:crotonobetainyl-CoA:carnitine CoA-transferase CaiB-like acyl-CoA transferase
MSTKVSDLLSDLKVIDFTQALSGPFCTMMLADLGADVVKIEATGRGDDSRHWGPPFLGDDSTYFLSVNRNKRSVELDLKDPHDLEAALKFIQEADILVENWSVGTADRLGVGYESARAVNRRHIYCSITGYGPGEEKRAAYDQIVQGTSGVMSITGPIGVPTKWGVPVADLAPGMFAATAIIAAVHARTRTGAGERIEISMEDSMIAMLSHHAARQLATSEPVSSEFNGHATIAPYGSFFTNESQVNICVASDSQFGRFCRALSLNYLLGDERYATNALRVVNREALESHISKRLLSMSTSEVISALEDVGVPVGAIRSVVEVLADETVRSRDMVMTIFRDDFGFAEIVNGPWKVNRTTPDFRLAPPKLGEHTKDLMPEGGEIAWGSGLSE